MRSFAGTAALIYRFAILLVCVAGLVLMTGFSEGLDGSEMFCYYTVQSNLLICLLYLVLCVKGCADLARGGCSPCYYPRLKGGAVLCIFATFLIFHFVLLPGMMSSEELFKVYSPASLFVHYAVPLMTIVDWLIFDARRRLRATDPLRWLLIPYGYYAGVLLRAVFGPVLSHGSRYPYFFIDVDKYGWLSVSRYLAVLTLLFVCLGYLIFLTDRIIASAAQFLRHIREGRTVEKSKKTA